MNDLIKRLQRLSGDNPVASVKLQPDDWPELEGILLDAERWQFARDNCRITLSATEISSCADYGVFDRHAHGTLDSAIDNARNNKETT